MSPAIASHERPTARAVRSVLIVDDHEILLKSLARDFDREGITVYKATTATEGLELAALHRPDLAIVDLFLAVPENGIEVIKTLKARGDVRFCILVSAHMSVAHAVLGVRSGADDVFLKPITARQALHRVSAGPGAAESLPELSTPTLQQIEWEHISRVLDDYDGNISQAARALGVFRQSLQRKIHKHAPRALMTDVSPRLAPPPEVIDLEPELEPELATEPDPEPPPAAKPRKRKPRKAR